MADAIAALTGQADTVAQATFEMLEGLPATEWSRPSDCAGWTVANIAAHLVLVEALLGGSVNRGLEGDSGPPPQAQAGPTSWMEYRTRRIAELGVLSPDQLLIQLRSGRAELLDAFGRLAAADAPAGLGWHPRSVFPLTWFPGQWLVEISLHDWDIRAPVDPEADLHPAARASLVGEMRARLNFCFKPDRAGALSGIVRVDCGADGAWLVRVANGQAEALDDGTSAPDATITTDGGTYALVQTARRPASLFAERGRWQVSGDVALTDGLIKSFSGF
jgi:uncharacterized protein (TIGR03083 family)